MPTELIAHALGWLLLYLFILLTATAFIVWIIYRKETSRLNKKITEARKLFFTSDRTAPGDL